MRQITRQAINKFNNEIANMQITDAIEDARLNAELTRMGGDATASALKSQGRTALIGSVGDAATLGYNRGLFT